MKRKGASSSKSKETDKSRSEDHKSYRHSRRRRSESSDSDDSYKRSSSEWSENKKKHRDSPKNVDKGVESPRATRYSKRLSGSNEDTKEEKPISLTLKISNKPDSKDSSPFKETKKKECPVADNSKSKAKEVDVWKVKSSNGRGSGELQKLKICRQRTPEPNETGMTTATESPMKNEEYAANSTINEDKNEKVIADGNDVNDNSSICSLSANNSKYLTSQESLCDISLPPESEDKSLPSSTPNYINVNSQESDTTTQIISNIPECNIPFPKSHFANVESESTEQTATKDVYEETISDVTSNDKLENSDNNNSAVADNKDENETKNSETDEIAEIETPGKKLDKTIVPEVDAMDFEEAADSDDKSVENFEMEKKSSLSSKVVSNNKILEEEEYDYDENEETKEEGEISGNESLSPVHIVYSKLRGEERNHDWGVCNIFTFNKSVLVCTEHVLRAHKIEGVNTSKDILLIDSDTDDLIFVREIRKDKVIHVVDPEIKRNSIEISNDSKIEEITLRSDSNKDTDDEDIENDDEGKHDKIKKDVEVKVIFNNRKKIKEQLGHSKEKLSSSITHNHRSKRSSEKRQKSPRKKSEKDNKHPSRSTPVKRNPTNILYITNLVRPFTIPQLKDLLQKTGKIARDGFWIDSIKSRCYVQYETEDEALETKHTLHGINWPFNNPKTLNVQYSTYDEMIKAQTQTDISEIPRKTEPLQMDTYNSRVKHIDWKRGENMDDKPHRVHNIGVREWDIGKPKNPDEMVYPVDEADKKQKTNISPDKTKQRDKKAQKSKTPLKEEPMAKKPKKPEDREAKVLDDLFRRTKVTPSIYWLPLTAEQIATKEELRRNYLEVMKQRIAKTRENDTRRRNSRHERSRRRSNRN